MSYQNIRVERRGPLAVVTLDRPRVLNALNSDTFVELDFAFGEIGSDPSVLAVLLTGAGEKAFAAGADISELEALDGTEGQRLSSDGQRIFDRIANCGRPVIACVNGFALGGGCELALACTIRLASETARMGLPEVKLGLIPGYGGTQRLSRLIGKSAALKLILTGEMVSAAEALRLGLVDEVTPPDQLLARGEQLALAIAAAAPLAVQNALRAVQEGYELPLREALDLEAALFGDCCATEDKAEGTRAFLEKRPAVWRSR